MDNQSIAVNAVLEMWLADGKGHTAQEIAEATGFSPSTVRKHLDTTSCVVADKETRASHSTNYPMFTSGSHRVTVYTPAKHYLRALLRSHRGMDKVA